MNESDLTLEDFLSDELEVTGFSEKSIEAGLLDEERYADLDLEDIQYLVDKLINVYEFFGNL